MVKKRLYDPDGAASEAARYSLFHVLLTTLKLFAPFLPYVTEEIYLDMFATIEDRESIHLAQWPAPDKRLLDKKAERMGEILVDIATAIRRHKSSAGLSLGANLQLLNLVTKDAELALALQTAEVDIMSITRAVEIKVSKNADPVLTLLPMDGPVSVAIDG